MSKALRQLPPEVSTALQQHLLGLADDELILAHRNSQWTGHGPILEEDIAFANIAQDEMGHALLWYRLLQQLGAGDPDQLVFFREAADFRSLPLVELPIGDWAFSMLRQYLFDAAELVRLAQLGQSSFQPAAAAANKIRPEEMYHLRHTSSWVKRLGLGTEESQRRMQDALDQLWPYAIQLFQPQPGETLLVSLGIMPDSRQLAAQWTEMVHQHLTSSALRVPEAYQPIAAGRTSHTPHLASLLADMQSVARLDPEAEW